MIESRQDIFQTRGAVVVEKRVALADAAQRGRIELAATGSIVQFHVINSGRRIRGRLMTRGAPLRVEYSLAALPRGVVNLVAGNQERRWWRQRLEVRYNR